MRQIAFYLALFCFPLFVCSSSVFVGSRLLLLVLSLPMAVLLRESYCFLSNSMPTSETPGKISRFMLCLTVMCSESFSCSAMIDTGKRYW